MEDVAERRYALNETVRTQLAGLTAWDGPSFWDRVAVGEREDQRYLAAEVLVMALRRFIAAERRDEAERIAQALLDRWGLRIRAWTRKWSANPEDLKDLLQEIHFRLWRKLQDPQLGFWEANFSHALLTLCIDTGTEYRRRLKPADPLPTYTDDDGEEQERELPDPHAQPLDAAMLQAEGQTRLGRVLLRLPEKERIAVYLCHVRGWPAASKDPAQQSVSRVLGVSDRMVRNYLRAGEARLRELYTKERVYGL